MGDGKIRHALNYSIANIDLHNGTFSSASKVFDDATLLAKQIAKRWNEYQDISSQLIACKEALIETTKELEQVFLDWYPYDDEAEIHRISSIVDKAKTLIE